jgi:DNA-binding response OmpR family regulator
MKVARLDQILMRLGYITEAHVSRALDRQRQRGGRLGSHLVELGFISDEQLTEALAEQHGVVGYNADRHTIDPDVVGSFTADEAREWGLIPLQYLAADRTLRVVVIDPHNPDALAAARDRYNAKRVELVVAPESTIAALSARWLHGEEGGAGIELPDLFEPDADPMIALSSTDSPAREEGEEVPVLMVGRSPEIHDPLVAIFRRDGYRLTVLSDRAEIEEATREAEFERVLVSQDMAEEFASWRAEGGLSHIGGRISVFTSVSQALLDNPAPYNRTVGSLFRAVRIIAESRLAGGERRPPYGHMCKDIRNLARRFGLGRLAADGLQLAAYLLAPPRGSNADPANGAALPVHEFTSSLEHARAVHFPWRIELALAAFRNFHTREATPAEAATADEVNLGGQILGLVWYRHVVLHGTRSAGAESRTRMRTELRRLAGQHAATEVVERYIEFIEDESDIIDVDTCHQILIVAETNEWLRAFTTRFARAGFRTVWTDDLADAQKLCERHMPAAVLIDHAGFADRMNQFTRVVKLAPQILLYALVSGGDPAVTLDLLDAGVDDVIAPPHDLDVIAARIARAVRSTSRRREVPRAGGFHATFDAFSLMDLVQALGQSRKSVRIDLTRSTGEEAVLFMERGRLIHASCGDHTGEQAVYRVITWENDGTFSVVPVEEFPPATISEPNESLLMEGCRILDESRA